MKWLGTCDSFVNKNIHIGNEDVTNGQLLLSINSFVDDDLHNHIIIIIYNIILTSCIMYLLIQQSICIIILQLCVYTGLTFINIL